MLITPELRRYILVLALGLVAACRSEPTEPTDAPGTPPLQRWSSPSAWPDGEVPLAGAEVVVPADRRLLLDVSPPALRSLLIEGTVQVDETRDVALTAGWIVVHGTLRAGTAERPYRKRLVITLNGPATDEIMGMGARVLGVMGGKLELFGAVRKSWTRLEGTAAAGATQLTVGESIDWRVGDRIVVASSDLDPFQAEPLQISAVSGRTVTFTPALRWQHWGQLQTFADRTVDQRAEVGLLSRNITIQGDPVSAPVTGLGGHIMVMQGGEARLSGVELYQMGQKKVLARYPLHWHLRGPSEGQFLEHSAVWKTFNRCITIHGTDQIRLEQNVCYDHIGHGIFLEDGAETGNVLTGNLGLVTRQPATGEQLLPSDVTPATFWITNPDNSFSGNVAAGSRGFGFWFALPDQPTGLSTGRVLFPRRTPLREFSDNVAHSNRNNGLHVDNGPRPDGTTETVSFRPRENPAAESPAVTAVFRNFRGYKHQGRAVWLRGHEHRLLNAVLADNAIGATFASSESFVEGSLFVGQTAIGGSAMPAGFPVRGYEFYDGRVGARNVTFVNYQPSAGRQMSAIGFNRANAFPINTGNYAEQAQFVNANGVYLEEPRADRDGDRAAVFLDGDGSVTGVPGHYVAANNPVLVTPDCGFRAEWNAWDCNRKFVRLAVRGINGEVIGPASVTRDDGATATYVGTGGDPVSVSMSLPVGLRYTVRPLGTTPTRPQLFAYGLAAADWVRVTLPYTGATVRVQRDYDTSKSIPAAASLAELDASSGDRYYHDAGARMIHLKLMAKSGRDWAALFVVP
ncbi:MAG TPA: G8 domain-containing protein [Gemmatimonadales bacterium]